MTDVSQEMKRTQLAQTEHVSVALRRNAALNFYMRFALYVLATGAIGAAMFYAVWRGDRMVSDLLFAQDQTVNGEDILAITIPIVLLAALAIATLTAAIVIQVRGANEFEEGIEAVNRLRREAHTEVFRRRATTEVLEAYLKNARRAFRLQLWLNQSLFIVFLTLFVVAVVDMLRGDAGIETAVVGATSLLSLILGVIANAVTQVGASLADATQIQLAVSSATRQMNLHEENLYQLVEERKNRSESAMSALERGAAQIAKASDEAMLHIQFYAEYPKQQRRIGRLRRVVVGDPTASETPAALR